MNKRVKYNRCPLVEVIFQLRFPTILSINSKQPADFQEKIRKEYPFKVAPVSRTINKKGLKIK